MKSPFSADYMIRNYTKESIRAYLECYGDGWWDHYDILYHWATVSPACIIEIGCYHAGSALVLATAALMMGSGPIISIDIRMRERLTPHQNLDFGRFREAVVGGMIAEHIIGFSGIGMSIVSIVASSDAAFPLVSHRKASLVFVDGNHDYEHVRRDIANYGSLLVPGGILICHDYRETERAIRESAIEFIEVEIKDDTWVGKRLS